MRKKVQQERGVELTLGSGKGGKLITLRGDAVHQHTHVMGTTGSGKTRGIESRFLLLHNQDIGCASIDPHGDACDHKVGLLADQGYFSDERAYSRLLYLDFSRQDAFVPFNFLVQNYDSHHLARLVWEAMTRAWPSIGSGGAPMMEQVTLAGTYVLAENKVPLTGLERLYTDALYRSHLLSRIHDPQILAFFQRFDEMGRRSNQNIESALRRLFLLSFSPALRYSLGAQKNLLDFRRIIDTKGIGILCNLSGLDPDTQRLLAALLMIGFEEAALSRADVAESSRIHFHLLCDEFPSYCSQSSVSFERLLSQARKMHLSLLLANQTWSQVDGSKLQGALQNASFIAHRLGPDDASWAAKRLTTIDPKRVKRSPTGSVSWMSDSAQIKEMEHLLVSLPSRQALVRLGQETIHLETLGVPDPKCSSEQIEAIKDEYARRLLTPKSVVEAHMAAQSPVVQVLPQHNAQERQITPRVPRARRQTPLEES